MTQELEPLEPETAVELYLAQRDEDSAERTKQAHWYRLKHFLRWCEEENVTNLNALTGRKLYEYRTWRRNDGDLNTVSLRTQLSTLRKFIRFCETIDRVEDGLCETLHHGHAGPTRRLSGPVCVAIQDTTAKVLYRGDRYRA